MKFRNTIFNFTPLFLVLTLIFFGCDENLDVDPDGTTLVGDQAYADETTIAASVNGIYFTMASEASYYSLTFNGVMSSLSDQTKLGGVSDLDEINVFNNEVTGENESTASIWQNSYRVIYQANALIDAVTGRTDVDEELRDQFLGEARFLRAMAYFQLVNYYGDIPLATTSDPTVNSSLSKTSETETWTFMESELIACIELLPTDYSAYDGSRARAIAPAARALLARVHLYRENWSEAVAMATEVIDHPDISIDLPVPADFVSLYDDDSPESIFELDYDLFGNFVPNLIGSLFGAAPSFFISDKLVNSFETGDLRRAQLVGDFGDGNFYCNKFDSDFFQYDERQKLLRLSEMYLIRAEASLRLPSPGLSTAASDINVIRNRAGLANTTATTQQDLLDAVAQERFVELAFEGHRWFDLIRTGQLDAVMSAEKPGTWNLAGDRYMPIPNNELAANPNLR